MKNNKGFIFLETIIVTVVLTTTLIFLYSNFSKNVNDERRRLYYDDIAYVYKTIFIRNAVKSTINDDIFKMAINDNKTNNSNSLENNFVYLFNSESKFCIKYLNTNLNDMTCTVDPINSINYYTSIYFDNTYVNDLNKLYRYKTLVYLKTSDINNIKKCINGGTDSFDNDKDKKRCTNFLSFTKNYSDANLSEYMLTINNIDADKDSIMLALFYERKDGSIITNGSYKSCLNSKILSGYESFCPSCTTDKDKVEAYYNQDSISYSMACEKAYYISWVYYE